MKIRSLPFGYRIKDGKICVKERDSSTVRMIFEGYIQEASYQKLADTLERQGIPYTPEKRWNKNIVSRILKDRHYLGDEEYPPHYPGCVSACGDGEHLVLRIARTDPPHEKDARPGPLPDVRWNYGPEWQVQLAVS